MSPRAQSLVRLLARWIVEDYNDNPRPVASTTVARRQTAPARPCRPHRNPRGRIAQEAEASRHE